MRSCDINNNRMIEMNAYKFRIYPTEEQAKKIDETFRCVKIIWNMNVAEFNKYSQFN